MSKFKKRPVTVDAFQWQGTNGNQLIDWVTGFGPNISGTEVGVDFATSEVTIKTKEGTMRGAPGCWIIRGVKGEYYPCQNDIFEQTYAADNAPLAGGDAAAASNTPRGVYEAHCTAATLQMAKKMYMAYCENSGNKNFRGEECPTWEALPTEVRSHWCAACIAGLPHLNVR
jgi:hypothetical protein